jgi:PAS domain S-box-containing protein
MTKREGQLSNSRKDEASLRTKSPTLGAAEFSPTLFEDLVEACPDAIIVADREGLIRYWNAGAVRIFGYEADEVRQQSLDLIIPPRLRERHWAGYDAVMKTGHTSYGSRLLKVPAVRRDGSQISVEFTLALLRDKAGQIQAAAAYVRDVTAAWKESQDLRERLARLENEAKKGDEG